MSNFIFYHENTKERKHENQLKNLVSVHGTLKLENRNWKFGFHAFVLLMNAFNFWPSSSTFVPLIKVVPDHI